MGCPAAADGEDQDKTYCYCWVCAAKSSLFVFPAEMCSASFPSIFEVVVCLIEDCHQAAVLS